MPDSSNSLVRDCRGMAALEFAFVLPLLLALAAGVTELGRALYQAQALDKAIRAGAVYAAHRPDPFSTATQTVVANLVRTGTADGTGDYIVPGLGDPSARVELSPLSFDLGGNAVDIVRVSVEVPFDPVFPVIAEIFDPSSLILRLSHEQAHIGS